ncbi:hypothetical protein F441_20936 [Phytophthora nicotianae CJ01A1]|uniref:Uncharacterized protein n=1 Tax=Phytophthora nicotianae CJ01A1 TaxID=1317063 RepID=W2VWZ3_PHYNI|nr:hypothetical protein F441_20936 [Phytophthora nicotianae CJ01A1]
MPSDADDVLDIPDDGDDSSSLSSYDSEEFGLVARKGFARMYVLSRNIQTDEDSKEVSRSSWNLLYASGQHYFHGPIEMPEDIQVREEEHSRRGSFFESISRPHEGGVELRDIPRLLPLLHAQQDSLTEVDDVVELTSGQRDAVYQMLEVGEFFVEELAKPRTTERLELGAKELPWLAEATENNNPAFFELQTHPNTNNGLADAGVRLVVMKLVVRGVLLDIIYSRDSYFVTLRDNTEEIALEDTFVPNVANAGPCYLVRRYSDEDLKQLLLWCPLPTDFSPLQKSTLKSTSPGEKSRILAANDTQFYCLIAKRLQTRKSKKKNSPTRAKQSVGDDDSGDIVDDAVVFQFNQFVYHGSAQLPTSMLDDSGALAGRGFPLLRAQASDLAFAGVYEEILGPGGEHEAEFPRTKFLSRFATIHQRFQQEIGFVLLDLLIGAQKWVHDFVREVPTASGGNALIATHLARWLEIEDGSESFFELELARGSLCPFAQVVDEDQAYSEQQPLDLMVWKGIVHDALLGVIYCRGSFFMTLKSVSDGVVDDEASEQLFAGVPTYLNKGRGYLVRRLPSTAGTPAWLAGAKLLLWQTSVSLEREEQDEAQIQASESKTPCKDWFEDDAKAEGKTSTKAQSKPLSLRPAEFADEKISSIAVSKADKVARPHHVSRLSSSEALLALQAKARASAQPVPWDRRTGRPL